MPSWLPTTIVARGRPGAVVAMGSTPSVAVEAGAPVIQVPAAATGTLRIFASFTGSAGSSLTAYTPELGGSFATQVNSSNGFVLTAAGRTRNSLPNVDTVTLVAGVGSPATPPNFQGLLPGQSAGTELYVAATGLDAPGRGSLAQPYATIAYAASHPQLGPGDTVWVRGGTYTEVVDDSVPSGAAGNYFRIAAYPGETVWFLGLAANISMMHFFHGTHHVELDGLNLDGTVLGNAAAGSAPLYIEEYDGRNGGSTGHGHHIRAKNATIIGNPTREAATILCTGAYPSAFGGNEFLNLTLLAGGATDFDHGIYLQSGNNRIESCDISRFTGAGIHLFNTYGEVFFDNVILNNRIHDGRLSLSGAGRHYGITDYSWANRSLYVGNTIWNIPFEGPGISQGFNVGGGSSDAECYFNTVYGCGQYGIKIDADAGPVTFRNSISYANAGGNYTNQGPSTTADHNLLNVDPLFVNTGAGDFSPTAGSPARNFGIAVPGITTDPLGVTRATPPTVGAYEYATLGPPVLTVPEYDVLFDLRILSLLPGHQYQVWARASLDVVTGYVIQYVVDLARWEMYAVVNSNPGTLLASAIVNYQPGTTIACAWRIRNTLKGFLHNSVALFNTTNNVITQIGRVGIGCFADNIAAEGENIGIHFDQLRVVEV